MSPGETPPTGEPGSDPRAEGATQVTREPRSPAFLEGVLRINGTVAVLLFAALTAVVTLQVLTRFVLHLPFVWSEEAARFLFFWTVLMGAAMSVSKRRHFVLDIAMGRRGGVPRVRRLLLDLIPDLCVLGFCVFLLVQGIGYVQAGLLRTATNSHVNMGLVYAAIPVFAALSIVYATANLIADCKAFVAGREIRRGPPPTGE